MIRLILASVALMSITACASSGPETAAADSSSTTGSVVVPKKENASDGPIDVVDIPADEQVAVVPQKEKMICHRVKEIGTHRTTKVCRTRGQIDAERAAARETLRENQMPSSPAVGGE